MARIIEIEGIGEVYAAKLKDAGVTTTEELLTAAASREGRKKLSAETGITESLILGWVNRADLFRIKGIGEQYSDLLEAAGVDTVAELAQRNAANLCQKLAETNEAKKLVRALPTETQVTDWIQQAQQLPRVVTY